MNEINLVDLFNKIRSADPAVREEGWKMLGHPEAVAHLAAAMSNSDKPTAKAAKELLAALAHRAARPGAATEASSVTRELVKVANGKQPVTVRAFALHLSGFTADNRAVPALAPFLSQTDVQDEARMALERIPGNAATNALKSAMKAAPTDFRAALAQSLANRMLTPKTVGMAAMATK